MAKPQKNKKRKSQKQNGRDPMISQIYANTENLGYFTNKIKVSYSYSKCKTVFSQLRPFQTPYIFGNSFPKEWSNFYVKQRLDVATEWLKELSWVAHNILKHHKSINEFNELRSSFGAALLLGEYAKARKVLELVDLKFGKSIWYAEKLLMLNQMEKGLAAQKETLSEVVKQVDEALFAYVFERISTRIEPHETWNSYSKGSDKVIIDLYQDNMAHLASIIELYTSPWSCKWKDHKAVLIHNLGGLPVIDCYNACLKIISYVEDDELSGKESEILQEILNDLTSLINDPQISNVLHEISDSTTPLTSIDKEYELALLCFTRGEYTDSHRLGLQLIQEEPCCFPFYWLTAVSSSLSGSKLVKPASNLKNDILETLEIIVQNSANLTITFEKVLKIGLILGDCHLGLNLLQLAFQETGEGEGLNISPQIKSQCKTSFALEEDCHYFGSLKIRGLNRRSNNPTILDLTENIFHEYSNLSHFATKLNKSHQYLKDGNYSDCIHLTSEFISQGDKQHNYHLSGMYFNKFTALIESEMFVEAADLIIYIYSTNSNSLRHIPFEKLFNYKDLLVHLPHWPCLIFLNENGAQDIYESIDDYLLLNESSSPYDLIEEKVECPKEILVVLLKQVIVPEVISRGALWAKSLESKQELRTRALRKLYEISKDDQQFVLAELAQIEQDSILRKAFTNVEGPKFNFNFDDIDIDLHKTFTSSFEKYCELKEYEDSGGNLTNQSELLDRAKEEGSSSSFSRTNTGAVKRVSPQILKAIATDILLVYCINPSKSVNVTLGNRIRHGSVENQITRSFGSFGMLAIKNTQGFYNLDQTLEDKLSIFSEEDNELVTKQFIHVTNDIFDIIEDLIHNQLRIQIPEYIHNIMKNTGQPTHEIRKDVGLFDYKSIFSDDSLDSLVAISYSDFGAFLKAVKSEFLDATSRIFNKVQDHFEKIVKQKLELAVDHLEFVVNGTSANEEDKRNIIKPLRSLRLEMSKDIRVIQEWFSYDHSLRKGVFSIGESLELAIKVVSFATNGKLGEVISPNLQIPVVNELGESLYEIFSILFRNIAQHSELSTGQQVIIEFCDINDSWQFKISNKVHNRELCENSLESVQRSIDRPFDEWALASSPGGTGYSRIKKLVKQTKLLGVEFLPFNDPDNLIFNITLILKYETVDN